MRLKKYWMDLMWILAFTLAIFYHNYKHKVVHIGNGDYGAYLNIAKKPLNPLATCEPFNQRQFTPVLARLIVESGLYYPTYVLHTNDEHEQRYYFAFMLVNYLGLVFMFILLLNMFDYFFPELRYFERLASIGIISGSMGFLFSGVSMMTEGWTYFFNLLLFYLFLRKKMGLFFLVGMISIFQRETSALFSLFFTGFLFLLDLMKGINLKHLTSNWKSSNSSFMFFITSLSIFVIYIMIKKQIFFNPNGVNQDQLMLTAWISKILNFRVSQEWLKQLLFTQWFLFFMIFIGFISKKITSAFWELKLSFLLTTILIIFIGIGTGIGPNIGRILSSFTPIWVFLFYPEFVRYMNKLEVLKQGN